MKHGDRDKVPSPKQGPLLNFSIKISVGLTKIMVANVVNNKIGCSNQIYFRVCILVAILKLVSLALTDINVGAN